MSIILFTPPMGESGYVSDVNWTRKHFHYNNTEGFVRLFNRQDIKRFLEMFKGDFKVFKVN